MEKKTKINVLYQTDDNYAPYTGVSISSLLRRHEEYETIHIYIIDNNISTENKRKIDETVKKYNRKVFYIDAKELVEYIKRYKMPMYRGGYTNYLKMFAGMYFTENKISIDRLLFIDSDSIILGDIGELFTLDMQDNVIGMVCDSLTFKFKNKYIGLKEEEPYYNAGMVLYDMKKWLEEDALNEIKMHIQNIRASYTSHEQDIMTVVFKGRILKMNPKYNFQPYHYIYEPEKFLSVYKIKNYYTPNELRNARNDIRIFHTYRFIGIFPWDDNDVHPANELFDRELQYTAWKNYNKKKKKLPLFIRFERILYKVLPKMWFLRLFMLVNYFVKSKENKESFDKTKR